MAYITIKNGDSFNHGSAHHEYQVQTVNDLADLPPNDPPGTLAYIESIKYVAMKLIDGTWDVPD